MKPQESSYCNGLDHGILTSEQASTLTGPQANTSLVRRQFLHRLEQIIPCTVTRPIFIAQ